VYNWAYVFGFFLVSFLQPKEYSEEFRDITKARVKESVPTGGITLLTQKSVSEDYTVRLFVIWTKRKNKKNDFLI
jgi:hypothetical protein